MGRIEVTGGETAAQRIIFIGGYLFLTSLLTNISPLWVWLFLVRPFCVSILYIDGICGDHGLSPLMNLGNPTMAPNESLV